MKCCHYCFNQKVL